jgi:signal transduction histidine kinase
VDFYVPIFQLGKVDEILQAHLSLKFIWDILEGIRIGKKGQVFVMDGSGCVIAHREIHRALQASAALTPETLKELREKTGPIEWVDEGDGAFYNLGIYLPGLDWIVALTQPRKEVYGYLYQNSYWAALIILVIAICAVFWGWRGSRRLLAPIQAMHLQVGRIGQGELDQKVSIDREDEIGDLGTAFNEMTDSLKKYVDREVETARTLAHSKNLAALGTVASKVSHEMGNFLFGLQMMISGLKKESMSGNGRNILKTIENEMAQTRIFIQAYMNFAKKPALNFTGRSLDGLIREVLEILRLNVDGPEAGERKITVTLNWDPAIPPIRLDAALMHQVFTNLVKNSMEAMSDSGNLTITGKAAGGYLLVSVADTGPGMDAETHEKLFEPFFSTKGVLGNGLGLAIVKANIEAHGGTIECVSKPGTGAEFLIQLPMD